MAQTSVYEMCDPNTNTVTEKGITKNTRGDQKEDEAKTIKKI
jgi:hypothetical protein